jgi:GH25 family lysozyme M1 (1,4-beta-N-acetylmuramidase)
LPHAGDLSGVMVDLDSHTSKVVVTQKTLQDAQIELVIHRLTIGRYPGTADPKGHDVSYLTRFNQVKEANGKFGAYHVLFPSPTGSENGEEQARGFLKAIRDFCPVGQKLLLAVDWEDVSCYRNGRTRSCGIPEPAYVESFVKYVIGITQKKILIYTFANVLSTYSDDIAKSPTFGKLIAEQPLWFAQPRRKFKTVTDTEFRNGYFFPNPADYRPWPDWTFWQFSAAEDKLRIKPTQAISMTIGGQPADFSWYNGGRGEFQDFYQQNAIDCSTLPGTLP